jgi:hypothetical protein
MDSQDGIHGHGGGPMMIDGDLSTVQWQLALGRIVIVLSE